MHRQAWLTSGRFSVAASTKKGVPKRKNDGTLFKSLNDLSFEKTFQNIQRIIL